MVPTLTEPVTRGETLAEGAAQARVADTASAHAPHQSVRHGGVRRVGGQGARAVRSAALLRLATRAAARILDSEIAFMARTDGDRLIRVASWGAPQSPRSLALADAPVAQRALLSAHPVAVGDRSLSDLHVSPPLRALGVRSSLAVAIPGRDSPYGVLCVNTAARRTYTSSDRRWLKSLAGVAAVVVERSRVDRELKATIAELTRIDEQRRALLAHLVTAQEEERHRVAADLHDDVIQLIAAASLRLEALRGRSGTDADGSIDTIQELIVQSSRRLRELLFELHPPTLERALVVALRAQLEQLTESTGIAAELKSTMTQEPDPSARTVLFRIAQEALTNVRKHSGAGRVTVTVRTIAGGTRVTIIDNGRRLPGLGSVPLPGHMGLTVMAERARLAGGWWRISNAASGGTAVEFWLPGLSCSPPGAGGAPTLMDESAPPHAASTRPAER